MIEGCIKIVWLLIVLCEACGSMAYAQDVVYTQSSKGELPRKGTIVDWTGSTLKLDMGGRERTINNEDIVRFETAWSPEYLQAESLLASRDLRAATEAFRDALQTEKRVWAQNIILARMSQCAHVLESPSAAGTAFVQLTRTDPQTRFLYLIPLPWSGSLVDRGTAENAKNWIQSRTPAVRLLGASWLLGTEARESAQEELTNLSRDFDPDIAHLAKLQLWRSKVPTARAQDLARLKSQIERMPKVLRAPALLLQGDIQSRLKLNDEAVLTLMRIPILHPENLQLSGVALTRAAGKLKAVNDLKSAERLYREVAKDYAGTRFARDAAAQLQAMNLGN